MIYGRRGETYRERKKNCGTKSISLHKSKQSETKCSVIVKSKRWKMRWENRVVNTKHFLIECDGASFCVRCCLGWSFGVQCCVLVWPALFFSLWHWRERYLIWSWKGGKATRQPKEWERQQISSLVMHKNAMELCADFIYVTMGCGSFLRCSLFFRVASPTIAKKLNGKYFPWCHLVGGGPHVLCARFGGKG